MSRQEIEGAVHSYDLVINVLLYVLTVFIWGSTWLAIKLQLGEASPEISIFYRFILATALLLLFCAIKRYSLKFSLKEHLFWFSLGITLFSLNYIFIYHASLYLASGVASVIFALASLFNIVNSFIFFRTKPEKAVLLGACLGFTGLIVFFWEEIFTLTFQGDTLLGLILILIGTFLFSLANMISSKTQAQKIKLIPSTTVSMGYGCLIMFAYVLFKGLPFTLPRDTMYWCCLLYLAIPGTLVALLCYLSLVSRIGPERSGYVTVFLPVVALTLSYFFEDYKWVVTDTLGVGLILVGNCFILSKGRI